MALESKALSSIYNAMMALLRSGNPCVRLDLSAGEHENGISIGQHGGWERGELVLMSDGPTPGDAGTEFILSPYGDATVARELAECLLAWADWVEKHWIAEPSPDSAASSALLPLSIKESESADRGDDSLLTHTQKV